MASLLIQIVTQVFPFFEIPNWAIRFVVLVIVISFPIALIIASPLHGADDDLLLSRRRSP